MARIQDKAHLLVVMMVLCFASDAIAQSANDRLSEKRYMDPKGYFEIVPPAGWRLQEYPGDSRGKVAFIEPTTNADLRALVNAVDISTMPEFIEALKGIEKRLGVNTNIQQKTFGGRQAIQRSYEMKGVRFYMIDFLVGTVYHNLQFAAREKDFERFLPIALKSMETYEPTLKGASEKDVLAHKLAKNRRLARLMIDTANFDLALEITREGLELSPQDPDLQKLLKEIESKKGKN